MNKTNRRGCGPYKKRRSDKAGSEDKQMNYMRGLSTLVNKACDKWLRERGIGPQDWRTKKKEGFKRRNKS